MKEPMHRRAKDGDGANPPPPSGVDEEEKRPSRQNVQGSATAIDNTERQSPQGDLVFPKTSVGGTQSQSLPTASNTARSGEMMRKDGSPSINESSKVSEKEADVKQRPSKKLRFATREDQTETIPPAGDFKAPGSHDESAKDIEAQQDSTSMYSSNIVAACESTNAVRMASVPNEEERKERRKHLNKINARRHRERVKQRQQSTSQTEATSKGKSGAPAASEMASLASNSDSTRALQGSHQNSISEDDDPRQQHISLLIQYNESLKKENQTLTQRVEQYQNVCQTLMNTLASMNASIEQQIFDSLSGLNQMPAGAADPGVQSALGVLASNPLLSNLMQRFPASASSQQTSSSISSLLGGLSGSAMNPASLGSGPVLSRFAMASDPSNLNLGLLSHPPQALPGHPLQQQNPSLPSAAPGGDSSTSPSSGATHTSGESSDRTEIRSNTLSKPPAGGRKKSK